MNKKFVGFIVLLVGLLVIVFSAFQVNFAMASSEPQVVSVVSCGGGNYKLDNLSDGWTEASKSWANTPGFDCPNGVASASFDIKAGNVPSTNACHGTSWNQNGWHVWEKWSTEEEKGDCKDISHVTISWICKCPPPPTETPVDPTATPVDPTETPVDPTATPVDPTATPVDPTATPVDPTPTTPPPTATPRDKKPGPGDTFVLPWILFSILGASVFFIGLRKFAIG
jgi:cell division septation protein DedD